MKLKAIGLNHTTAPLDLRERLAVPREQVEASLAELTDRAGLREVMLLSTCNRVEVYAVDDGLAHDSDDIVNALADIRGVTADLVRPHCFARCDDVSAATHIFRVAASLESMVIGEPQILGQVKDAYQVARNRGTVGAVLDRCLTMAFRGAKRVRTETDIARGGASVASVAVDLARSIFGRLDGSKVVLVGAGEMSQHAGVHLRAAGCSDVVVVNRGEARGRALAEAVEGRYEPWGQLEIELGGADIVVASTGSDRPIIDVPMMRTVMRRRRGRPVFLVDIAVPRDVDPKVHALEGAYVYDVDDLQGILRENMQQRGVSADQARLVVDQEVDAFLRWKRARTVTPVIRALTGHTHDLVDHEIERLLARLPDLDPEERVAIQRLGHQIAQKLLHQPLTTLREVAERDQARHGTNLAAAVANLYGLETDPADEHEPEQDDD